MASQSTSITLGRSVQPVQPVARAEIADHQTVLVDEVQHRGEVPADHQALRRRWERASRPGGRQSRRDQQVLHLADAVLDPFPCPAASVSWKYESGIRGDGDTAHTIGFVDHPEGPCGPLVQRLPARASGRDRCGSSQACEARRRSAGRPCTPCRREIPARPEGAGPGRRTRGPGRRRRADRRGEPSRATGTTSSITGSRRARPRVRCGRRRGCAWRSRPGPRTRGPAAAVRPLGRQEPADRTRWRRRSGISDPVRDEHQHVVPTEHGRWSAVEGSRGHHRRGRRSREVAMAPPSLLPALQGCQSAPLAKDQGRRVADGADVHGPIVTVRTGRGRDREDRGRRHLAGPLSGRHLLRVHPGSRDFLAAGARRSRG